MFRRATISLLLLVTVIAAAGSPTASAAATPKYDETVVVEDIANDFGAPGGTPAGGGMFDIVAVYMTEKFLYDPEKQEEKGNHTVFRIETRSLRDTLCATTIRYDLFFKVNGGEKNANAIIAWSAPGTDPSSCTGSPAGGTGSVSTDGATNVFIAVPSSTLGITAGSAVTDIWAQSATVAAENAVPQDVAPFDNQNAPAPPQTVASGGGSYNAVGVFPYIVANPLTSLNQYSVGGQEVKYDFDLVSNAGMTEDNVRVRFMFPEGWTISPSQGRTGADPEGQVSTIGGTPRNFFFGLSATGIVNEGDMAHVVMKVITDAGGYAEVMTMTSVSGPKITDPNFTVELLTKGPFKAGDESIIRFKPTYSGAEPAGATFSVDVAQGTKKLGPGVAATKAADGAFEAKYTFPSEGDYNLDVLLSSARPSPFQTFSVKAEKGGLAAGPELVLVGAALALAFALRTRKDG